VEQAQRLAIADLLIRLPSLLTRLLIGMRDDGIDRFVPSSLLGKVSFEQFQAGYLTVMQHLPHGDRG
jgi:hypothetical protein